MSHLTHEALHEQTLDAARNEKSATLVVLEFLKQVEDRRTYAVLGFSTLFLYVEKGLGYSPSQASERISAMGMLRRVPAVARELTQGGGHTFTSLIKIATHVKRENLNAVQAAELVQTTAHQSVPRIEKHLWHRAGRAT